MVESGDFMEVRGVGPDFWRELAEAVGGGEDGGCAGEVDVGACLWEGLEYGGDAGVVVCVCEFCGIVSIVLGVEEQGRTEDNVCFGCFCSQDFRSI
jgi:hypothetical protein